MMSRLVIAFLQRSKRLNFMAAVTICSDFRTGVECHISPLFFSLSLIFPTMGLSIPNNHLFVLVMVSWKGYDFWIKPQLRLSLGFLVL